MPSGSSTNFTSTPRFPAAAWREWAGSEEFSAPASRLAQLGLSRAPMRGLVEAALADPGWRPLLLWMPPPGWSPPSCVLAASVPVGRPRVCSRFFERRLARQRARKRTFRRATGWSGQPRPDRLMRNSFFSGCGACPVRGRRPIEPSIAGAESPRDQLPSPLS